MGCSLNDALIRASLVLLVGCENPQSPGPLSTSSSTSTQSILPLGREGFVGWSTPTGDWLAAGEVSLDPLAPQRLLSTEEGEILVNGPDGLASNLVTEVGYADVEVHAEFLIAKGANSGIYLQSRYEVQIRDSWDVEGGSRGHCGGIQQRWVDGKFQDTPARENVSLPPGNWQYFDITFRAPRFDPSGRKVENGRFVKVVHNGVIIHENVEVTVPTRSAPYQDENAVGPIMIQGNRGAVAYRNLIIRPVSIP